MQIAAMAVQCTSVHRVLLLVAIIVLVLLYLSISLLDVASHNVLMRQHDVYRDTAAGAPREYLTGDANNDVDNDDTHDDDKTLHVTERLCFDFDFGGDMFDKRGRRPRDGVPTKVPKSQRKRYPATSCLIHSFSPYIEREAARRFLDPAADNVYFANSPAIIWHRNQLVLVTRIWLDREKYEEHSDWPANHFADNWLYTQRFDRHMRPISNGSVLGIPAPKQWWVGDGPIEPRLFHSRDRLFVTFNSAMAFGQNNNMDYTIMWDLDQHVPIVPRIDGGTPMVNATEPNDMPRDKHWMALVEPNGRLFFVHCLDPLRVLTCSLTGACHFVHKEEDSSGFIFRDHRSHLRGGTPFELYMHPYYVSVAHTTMYKTSNTHRYYSAHLVVLSVLPTHRVVYVSDPLEVHPLVYRSAPMVRPMYIDDGFIFPVGLVVENRDSIALGVHVNDFSSVVLRFKGMQRLMDDVMRRDKESNTTHGPPVGSLQQYIHETLTNYTKTVFMH